MTSQEIVRLGIQAKELMDSDCFKNVIEALKNEACEQWFKSPADAKEAREDLYYFQVALATIKGKLSTMSDNARIEKHKAEQEETRQQGHSGKTA